MTATTAFEERVVEIDGVPIQLSIGGNGPPLLMLNGLGADLAVLEPLRRALSGFTTITLDPPGVGRSGNVPGLPIRLPRHATFIAKLLDLLELERVDLFGVSWGGALAQELAFRYPQRIGRMILVSTTAGPGLLASPMVYLAFLDPRNRTSEAYVDKVAPTLFGGPLRRNARDLLDAGIFNHLAKKSSKSYLYQMASALGWSSLPYIWSLPQPTLIISGDDDPLVRPYNSRLLNLLLPNSELQILAGEGHFLVVTSARQTANLIEGFLGKEDGTPASVAA